MKILGRKIGVARFRGILRAGLHSMNLMMCAGRGSTVQ